MRTIGNAISRDPGSEAFSATTNVHGSDLLWVFSSSTLLEANRSYDRFGAFTVLDHNGDHAAAAASLASFLLLFTYGFTNCGASSFTTNPCA